MKKKKRKGQWKVGATETKKSYLVERLTQERKRSLNGRVEWNPIQLNQRKK